MQTINHYIDGESVPSKSGKTFLSENPATEETIAEVAFGESADIDVAVESAGKAFEGWEEFLAPGRGEQLF